MKTKYWIALLATILVICIGLSIPLLISGGEASSAKIISNGQLIQIMDLKTDQEITITTDHGGKNTVTVKDGKIGVTQASCPDHYCMNRGMCSGGTQIVCLPNRLIIQFSGPQEVDTVAG